MFGIRLWNRELVNAGLALAVLGAASMACVSGSDEAPGTSSSSSANLATVTVTLSGASGYTNASVFTDKVFDYSGLDGQGDGAGIGTYRTNADASGQAVLSVKKNITYTVGAYLSGWNSVSQKQVRITGDTAISLRFDTPLAANDTTYVGSSSCRSCHLTQWNLWKNSFHARAHQAPGDSSLGIPAAVDALIKATGGVNLATADSANAWYTYGSNAPVITYDSSRGVYVVTIGSRSYDVSYIHGGNGWKFRFLTKIGSDNYILPVQYNYFAGHWSTYNPTDWYTGTTPKITGDSTLSEMIRTVREKSYELKCSGCHSTGLAISILTNATTGDTEYITTETEHFIGCEQCHGPGSRHVWNGGGAGTITNPADLPLARRIEVCGACHSRGYAVARVGVAGGAGATTGKTEAGYNGTRYYRPGDRLFAFVSDGDDAYPSGTKTSDTAGQYWNRNMVDRRYSSKHHQQYSDFYQDTHLYHGLTCSSCHDPHGNPATGTGRRHTLLPVNDNTLCLSCHGTGGTARYRFSTGSGADSVLAHINSGSHTTYNPGGTGAGRCISCHMVQTASSANQTREIRTHNFRAIPPTATRDMYMRAAATSDTFPNWTRVTPVHSGTGIPNSCQDQCHNGVGPGTDWYLTANATARPTDLGVAGITKTQLTTNDSNATLVAVNRWFTLFPQTSYPETRVVQHTTADSAYVRISGSIRRQSQAIDTHVLYIQAYYGDTTLAFGALRPIPGARTWAAGDAGNWTLRLPVPGPGFDTTYTLIPFGDTFAAATDSRQVFVPTGTAYTTSTTTPFQTVNW